MLNNIVDHHEQFGSRALNKAVFNSPEQVVRFYIMDRFLPTIYFATVVAREVVSKAFLGTRGRFAVLDLKLSTISR